MSETLTDTASRISSYLATKLPDAENLRLVDLQQMDVGWSHETFLFDACYERNGVAERLPLCLRRDPGNALLRDFSDLDTQFRVLQCLESTALATPRPYWFESDPEILGNPFLVMEKVEGTCPSPWGSAGKRFYAEAAERGVLPGSFTDALATLHRIDWREAGLDFLGVPEPGPSFALREIDKWQQLVEASKLEPDPILSDLMGWLRDHAPTPAHVTLVHGAYRTGNLLIHEDRISAVLDWELQVIGDPMYDVAYVLADLNREGTDLLSYVVSKDEFYRRYEDASGIAIDEDVCRYYQMLYLMRGVAFWMSAAGLYASGESDDIRLARTAWSIPVVLDSAARALGY